MIQRLWIIFSVLFLILTFFHTVLSTKKIPKVISRAKVKSVMGMNLGIAEFINDFGIYVDNQNKANKIVNIVTAIGYFVAFLTSIYSYYLSR